MSQQELLIKVANELERLHIPYMVTGSIVSSLQGEPRATHDIDIVISIQRNQAQALVEAFQPPDYYLDEDSVLDGIERGMMFNLLELKSGDKVDFWLLADDEYDQCRFQRRMLENIFNNKIFVSSPEDTILMKLKWAKLSGGSEKQIGDSLRIYEVQREFLDDNYLRSWASKLGIESLLQRIKDEAGKH